MTSNDPIIAAAAILLGLVPGQHAQSAHQLPPAPASAPQAVSGHMSPRALAATRPGAANHISVRWAGQQPAAQRLSVIRQTDPNAPDPPRHHRRHHHHRRGHHHR